MNEAIKMQLSAFVDGELPANEAELLLRRMSQDGELRQQVAEYLEIGRLMRGEHSVRGLDTLRERVAAELDERPLEAVDDVDSGLQGRSFRPLAGLAIAATVTLVAILGLRQVGTVNPEAVTEDGQPQLVDSGVDAADSYTVPSNETLLRQYMMSHGDASSEHGANSINARLVSLQLSQEIVAETELESEPTDEPPDEEGDSQ